MAVIFEMDYLWQPVGSGNFLHAFFSNIGRDLIEMLFEVFREDEQEKSDIEVTNC